MRPDELNSLFRSVTVLNGVGPKVGALLGRLAQVGEGGEARLIDLLFHMPSGIIDRNLQDSLTNAEHGVISTFKVHIDDHRPSPPANRRAPYRVHAHDETGEITFVFFNAKRSWMEKLLPEGETRFVSGRVEMYQGEAQMTHPDYCVSEADFRELPPLEPVYPLTHGLSSKVLRKIIHGAIEQVPDLPEWQDESLLKREGWPAFRAALRQCHMPEALGDVDPASKAWTRLAYDEYLASQLALALVRATIVRENGEARVFSGVVQDKIAAALPFTLTNSQQQSIAEIEEDLRSPNRMLRLVQGDVGSGKTLVALMAMAAVAEARAQSVMMAPTDLLARQHFATLDPLCEAAGLKLGLLTGRDKGKAREAILADLASGVIDILVGTHAVFQTGVTFANLGLTVIDEQHRFGVHQRLALSDKGDHSDVLVITATPIPRTLILTHFGDMDVSQLTEKPVGRQPIKTSAAPMDKLDAVIGRLQVQVNQGAKAYWVCPLVEESEFLPVTSAEDRFASLKQVFGDRVGLVHGRMKSDEKQAAMEAFSSGATRILVSTTVIEVGVDVPDATIMIIEHAERFGLSQLHQLRGRVGRSDKASSCLLLYKAPAGEVAKARLETISGTEDGFVIAEADLRLRGEGDVLGTRQSGMPGFRVAVPDAHYDLLEMARDDARLILTNDPGLTGPRGKALRLLLYVFGRDQAVRLLSSG